MLGAPRWARVNLPPGSYTVNAYYNGSIPLPSGSITLTDFRYNPSFATGTEAVTPEDASLAFTGSTVLPANTTVNLSATVTQAADGYPGDLTQASVQFNVMNGTTVVATASAPVTASGTASTSIAGLAVGLYQVTTSLTGGFFTAQAVNTQLAVYNPSASIVAGIGTINSPAGDYMPDLTLTGTTGFAFLAYYKSGATRPTGQAVVQFKAGNLLFSSRSLDWLVISGSQALLEGSGTVNSAGSYGFLISVIAPSSGQDLFRVKIWDKTNGSVLYDSQPGSADAAAPTSTTSGISIILQ